jgi:hypothetical protein
MATPNAPPAKILSTVLVTGEDAILALITPAAISPKAVKVRINETLLSPDIKAPINGTTPPAVNAIAEAMPA